MNAVNELIPTRESLLSRLSDWNDQKSWKTFFDTYWRLIYTTAIKAGLTDAEAQDVVQETIICVCKNMKDFRYDKRGSFKGWLLRLTSWRVADQFRIRQKFVSHKRNEPRTSTETDIVDRIEDPFPSSVESAWNQEWEENLVEVALERVKRKVDGKAYQVFDLYVVKKWPVSRISTSLKINPAKIYLAKHRVGKLIKKEIMQLRRKPL